MIDGVIFKPLSLPCLTHLYISDPGEHCVIAGLLSAAGPQLTTISINSGYRVTTDAVSLMAEQNYPWLPALRVLELDKCGISSFCDSPAFAQLVAALSRLPALKKLTCPFFDELIVRLLALAEGGGLPSLTHLILGDRDSYHVDENMYEDDDDFRVFSGELVTRPGLTVGALALLLLWLKREAKKAVDGTGPAAVWEVRGLIGMTLPTFAENMASHCLNQLKKARERL
jgi:hypothetical protein